MARLKRAKDIQARNKARKEGESTGNRNSDDEDETRGIHEDYSILDRVRPEVRDEALQLQQRLQQLIAEGSTPMKPTSGASIINDDDEYNDHAPFPLDVRVNNKVVEVLAPIDHQANGKKYRAARKSAARWQPLPPRQVAQLSQENTPSTRRMHQEYQRHLALPTSLPQPRQKPNTVPTRRLRSGTGGPKALPQQPKRAKPTAHDDEQESDVPVTRPRRSRVSRHPLFDDSDEDEECDKNEDGDSDDDEVYGSARRRTRSRRTKRDAKSIAELVAEFEATKPGTRRKHSPVLFPASQPPPKLFVPAKRLRKGYQVVAEEKKKVHPTFDLDKTHPIDRHLRTINKTTGTLKKEGEKSLTQRVKPPSTIPDLPKASKVEPQVPDVVQGEEAYRGKIFRTIEGGEELGREGSSGPSCDDDGVLGDSDDTMMVLDRSPTPEPRKDWREEFLPLYLEEAEQDPFAAYR
ncbi:hypothetical protein GP486_005327 [Trichoglossum hirsutum]|uniref:Uncharacterized protein n=1 Tax=Trichoglossum hirsutum TaxID=265104 RepID=A0A9P8L9G3_9PEZI|nr:hypothetical protein GP486_005327 [Trichoglossum hirsutum]